MDEIEGAVFVSTAVIVLAVGIVYVRTHRKLDGHHGQVRRDIGDVGDQVQGVSDQVEGVRISIDAHADRLGHESSKDRAETKKFRLSIFRDFNEWLKSIGREK